MSDNLFSDTGCTCESSQQILTLYNLMRESVEKVEQLILTQGINPGQVNSVKKKSLTRVTEEWQPSQETIIKCCEIVKRSDISEMVDSFKNYWMSRGERRANWNAALVNWAKNEAKWSNRVDEKTNAPILNAADVIAQQIDAPARNARTLI